ncbi:hypothetical protein AVEN_210095-1 [Araneus ventricosus]|uniref:RNase H type-1 domain-containing protein n=1 Tax=Araneus ventricosus TaxID=182803 RepID=A0A4Y2GB13_ARAVE|nr:hypothetical protein AVEN_210095-1 [Araneus ventricosus]
MNVLNKLKSLSVSYRIHLQWIPSHVNIQGNEIADALAKASGDDASVPSAPLTYSELFSRAKSRNKTICPIPPLHHWYQGFRLSMIVLSVLRSAQNGLQNRPHRSYSCMPGAFQSGSCS